MSQIIKNLASGPVPPSVPTTFTEDVGTATPALNNLNIFGGTGITTSGSGNTIFINVQNGGFLWVETAGPVYTATAQQGIFCTGAMTVDLPPTAGLSLGATIYIYSDTASSVVIQANTGQFIEITGSFSTSGGTATSNAAGSFVWLVFRPSDLTWHALSSMGTYTTA